MRLKVIALTIFMVALSGCVTPQIPLTKQAQKNIDQVEAILVIPQKNLNITVPSTNPGNTGLIGVLVVAIIDSSRQSSAERAAVPMMESLRDYDFRAVILDASTNALAKIDKVKVSMPLRVETEASVTARRSAFEQSTASAILFCNVNYRVESGNLIVNAYVNMYPKVDVLKQFREKPVENNPIDIGNAIYRKTFTFTKQAVTASNIKESLSEAATSVAAQLATDLNQGV